MNGNDEALDSAWTTLEPAAAQRRRIDTQVYAWLDAHDTTLAAEWLALFKVAPLTAFGLVTVSTIAMVVTSPFTWLVRVL
jgi:hypothetical protein